MKRPGLTTMKRSAWVVVLFIIMAVFLALRLYKLQILDYDDYLKKVTDEITVKGSFSSERGLIYDTNGNLLVTNIPVYRVFISPTDIQKKMIEPSEKNIRIRENYTEANVEGTRTTLNEDEMVAHLLVSYLNVDYDTVIRLAAKEKRYDETVLREVDEVTADALREAIHTYDLDTEILLEQGSKRYYCYGNFAAQTLGFVGKDGNGVIGLESQYNTVLRGSSGHYVYAKDAKSQDMPFKYEAFIEPEDGYNMVTTLDLRVQNELETQLKRTYETNGANRGVTGIVMNIKTGAILGMGTYPDFNLNEPYDVLTEEQKAELEELEPDSTVYQETYSNFLYETWRNKATTDRYEPGSTTKIITASIAIEEQKVALDDTFVCTGSYFVDGYPDPVHCHKEGGHGYVTFAEGFQQSCNPTFMETAKRIGKNLFYYYFENYGYTEKTGIDLPSEYSTIFSSFEDMHALELAIYSFGQTFKTTAIQQITALSAVANDGYLVTPHLMKQIVDEEGNVIEEYQTRIRRQVISEETSETIMQVLEEGVAGNGAAKNAYVKGYKIAAKTGTSEKTDQRDYAGKTYLRVGSCVAFAPADDPEIAALIVVDEPNKGNVYGSVVAAPYISKLMGNILPYLGFEADYSGLTQNEEYTMGRFVGCDTSYVEAVMKNRRIDYEIIGNGYLVTALMPEGGQTFDQDSATVYIYTNGETPESTVMVPDVFHKNDMAATRTLIGAHLNIKRDGAANLESGKGAVVVSQTPPAGTMVPRGTVVTVEYQHVDATD